MHNQSLHLREQAIVVGGTKEASHCLERVLTNNPGIGIKRHVDTDYDLAKNVAKDKGVKISMMWE